MSSLKLSEDTRIDAATTEEWVAVRSPLRERPLPEANGVILSIAALRDRYRRGDAPSVELDLDQIPKDDDEFMDDIQKDIDERWDD
ncbi:hypothetical protein [Kribbella sp. VKM Ac-2566]|uniref:hypothetical protein n=1 Tax=Kribbella sp. VKM Ac-2566 TaxID=2512218 RepID=UPI0010642706|nr:hypothetical protein [Kribbella sp. VKM Ac-2566]